MGVYVRALVLGSSALVKKARGRLLRCADKVGLALAQQLGKAKPSEQAPLSDVLAEAAPKDAVNAIVPLLDVGSAERRRPLRVALAKASRRARAQTEVRRLLIDTSVPPLAALDLLRALGPRAPDFAPESARAFERFARVGDFRTRYLLLEPAAALAPKLPAARTYLGRAISADADPNIRAQAARLVPQPAPFRTELLRALEDSSVRVREAAVVSLRSDGNFAKQALLQRLSEDPWPLVRSATAETMARLAPDPEVDRALCEAVDDESPSVRAPVMRAVGARAVTSCAEPIRAAVEDQEQAPDVRIAAVEALGLMCDSASLDLLTSYARRAADQMLVSGMREMAFEAIEALGRIHPPDLALRLAPLRVAKVPPAVRGAADRALASPIQCGRARRAAPVPAS
jgi:HEAT repeat protein